jgi:hypothetical protein
MKKMLTLSAIAALLILVSACSKEKKFERMLYKSEGQWGITSMTFTLITTDENYDVDTLSATAQNTGVFEFDDDGDGSYSFIIDNTTHQEGFSWNIVNETALTITRLSSKTDFFTDYTKTISIAMTGEKTAKNKITLTGSEIITDDSGLGDIESKLTATFNIEKN